MTRIDHVNLKVFTEEYFDVLPHAFSFVKFVKCYSESHFATDIILECIFVEKNENEAEIILCGS